MTIDEFRALVSAPAPPGGSSDALQSLWWDAKGDWDRAHACAQRDPTPSAAGVHAYLHRKAGDMSNAAGWYRRAGRTPPVVSLAAEWESLAQELLGVQD